MIGTEEITHGLRETIEFHSKRSTEYLVLFNKEDARIGETLKEFWQHMCEWHKTEQIKREMALESWEKNY
jgi:hypothetical protein